MNEIIQAITIYAIPVIFAITLHESAHAYVAKYFGDTTAYSRGRLSLNPLKHIDPVGTVLLPVILFIASAGTFAFGYAKPVPIDFGKLRNPKKDMVWVALAGPASNFFMAIAWFGFYVGLALTHVDTVFFPKMAQAGLQINIIMFALNLFPMLPLDGGRILAGLLPHKMSYEFAKIEPYGFFIVLGLLFLHILDNYWLTPISNLMTHFFNMLLSSI